MKRLLLLLALCPAPALAQGGEANAGSAVGSVAPMYRQVQGYLVAAAEQMPEADYAHRPTPEVRSFGQLIGHVANANYMICAAALGEASPARQNFEQTTEKAALVQALRASGEYCDRAYAQSDESALQMTQLFGAQRTRLSALMMNAVHDWEHYGNLVTYMRLKGMVPPSSSQGGN